MKFTLAAACLTAATAVYLPPFDEWVAKVRAKNYTSDVEYSQRASIYLGNMRIAAEHNAANRSWTLGATMFADLTHEEFLRGYVRASPNRRESRPPPPPTTKLSPDLERAMAGNTTGNPPVYDWCNNLNACQMPYQQTYYCYAGYAISTVEVVEVTRWLQGGMTLPLPRYAPQSIIDCGFKGCDGDDPWEAVECITLMGYLPWAVQYPWTAVQYHCQLPKPPATPNYGFEGLPTQNEALLETALMARPLVVKFNSYPGQIQLYNGGVIDSMDPIWGCAPDTFDMQSAMLVGFNNVAAKPYWRIMNSWGTSWGEDGFIRLGKGAQYNPQGVCGVQLFNMRAL